MKYYLVTQISLERDDAYTLYNHAEHFLLKVENEIQYHDFDENGNQYHNHQLTELTENQFNCLKDTLEVREILD